MSQKLPVNGFKWLEDTSEINENNENMIKDIFSK